MIFKYYYDNNINNIKDFLNFENIKIKEYTIQNIIIISTYNELYFFKIKDKNIYKIIPFSFYKTDTENIYYI